MKPINTPDGHFVGGNGSNVKPTIVTAKWLNDVQDEILNVIKEVNINPDEANQSQLLEAIKKVSGVDLKSHVDDKTAHDSLFDTKADKKHSHAIADITDFDSAIQKLFPVSYTAQGVGLRYPNGWMEQVGTVIGTLNSLGVLDLLVTLPISYAVNSSFFVVTELHYLGQMSDNLATHVAHINSSQFWVFLDAVNGTGPKNQQVVITYRAMGRL